MAAITSAVVGTAVALKGQRDAKKASQKAAKRSEAAAIESAQQLVEATRAGERDIISATNEAALQSALGATEAAERIQPFVDPGLRAFDKAERDILQNRSISGPLAESIRGAATVNDRVFDTSQLKPELNRQRSISVSGLSPDFRSSLLTAGNQGLAAAADVGSIRSRGFDSLADIIGGSGAQRASLLVGAGPELQNLSSGADEARILGDVAGQRFNTQATNELAKLAGKVF